MSATDTVQLFYQAMLGYGFQPESVIEGFERVVEEHYGEYDGDLSLEEETK